MRLDEDFYLQYDISRKLGNVLEIKISTIVSSLPDAEAYVINILQINLSCTLRTLPIEDSENLDGYQKKNSHQSFMKLRIK